MQMQEHMRCKAVSRAAERRAKRIIRNRRDHHGSLLVMFLILAAAVFLANLITKDKSFSPNENRSLAQKPKLTQEALKDGSFFSDYTTYYSDQFPLRDFFVSLKFRVDYMLNQREFSGVYVGKDGTLLQEPAVPDMEAINKTTDAINRFAAKYADKDISVLIVPDSATIWKDHLPPNAPARNQTADITSFTGALNSRIRRIDAANALNSHRTEEIYYKTDHHWTSLGAYAVFEACTDPLRLAHEGIVYTPHVVSESFQGTLSSRSGDHRNYDTITVYEPQGTDVLYEVNYPDLQKRSASLFVSEQLEEKDQYTVFFGGNHPLVEIRTTADNGRSLLIFKDSYANSFIQFLTPYYQNIIMVDPRYYYDDVSLAMNTYGITDVMFLYSADTLLTDTALADVLNAATAEETEAPDTMNNFDIGSGNGEASGSEGEAGTESGDRQSSSEAAGDSQNSEETGDSQSSEETSDGQSSEGSSGSQSSDEGSSNSENGYVSENYDDSETGYDSEDYSDNYEEDYYSEDAESGYYDEDSDYVGENTPANIRNEDAELFYV